MTHRSKSTLFLIEQLIVIAVFAICAVACISILTAAYFAANDSRATSHAILKAESSAEVLKATGGNMDEAARILGGVCFLDAAGATVLTVYYDNSWQPSNAVKAYYVLDLITTPVPNTQYFTLITGTVTVSKVNGEQLVELTVAARGELLSRAELMR